MPNRWNLAHGLHDPPPRSFIDDPARAIALHDASSLEVRAPDRAPLLDWWPYAEWAELDGEDALAELAGDARERAETRVR